VSPPSDSITSVHTHTHTHTHTSAFLRLQKKLSVIYKLFSLVGLKMTLSLFLSLSLSLTHTHTHNMIQTHQQRLGEKDFINLRNYESSESYKKHQTKMFFTSLKCTVEIKLTVTSKTQTHNLMQDRPSHTHTHTHTRTWCWIYTFKMSQTRFIQRLIPDG